MINKLVGFLCEFFSINCNKHTFYVFSYKDGCEIEFPTKENQKTAMEEFISALDAVKSTVEPYRTNGICSVRGYRDAYKKRFCSA